MSKRKGELSNAAIDRRWPHQVALLGGGRPVSTYQAPTAPTAAEITA
jgi:hypothetical protein